MRRGAAALARLFRSVYFIDAALRRRLTAAGWFAAALLVASAAFGLNTRLALIYQLFGLCAGLLALAFAATRRFRPGLTVSRHLPETATAGEPFEYALRVRNGGPRRLDAIDVLDGLRPAMPDLDEFLDFDDREDRARNPFDRYVGYPRWVRRVRRRTGARFDWMGVGALAPGAERTLVARCEPLRRGLLEFDRVHLGQPEPLGLMRRLSRVPLRDSLLVLPKTYPVATPDLPGSRRLQPGGIAFAGRVGDAEEFLALRDYRAGDSPRRIHWKAWARTGRPVVKEYQDEFFVRHGLVLDTFSHRGDPRAEAAVSIAASYAVAPRRDESLLDLMFVEQRAYTLTVGRSVGSAHELLRVLAVVPPSGPAGFEGLAECVLLHASRLSGAIVVLLAWDEPRRRLVAALRDRGIPVLAWVVRNDAAAAREGALDPGPLAGDPGRFRAVTPGTIERELARA